MIPTTFSQRISHQPTQHTKSGEEPQPIGLYELSFGASSLYYCLYERRVDSDGWVKTIGVDNAQWFDNPPSTTDLVDCILKHLKK